MDKNSRAGWGYTALTALKTLRGFLSISLAVAPSLLGAAALLPPGAIVVCDPFCALDFPAILVIDPITGAQSVLSDRHFLHHPNAVVIDSSGRIFVADQNVDGEGALVRIDPATGLQTQISRGGSLVAPSGLALDGQGSVYVTTAREFSGGAGIIRINLRSGEQTPITSGDLLISPRGLALGREGMLYVTDPAAYHNGRSGGIIQVNPVSGQQTPIFFGPPLVLPLGIFQNDLGALLIVDAAAFSPPIDPGSPSLPDGGDGPGGLIAIDPGSRTIQVVSEGNWFVDPCGLARESDGNLLVVDLNAFGYRGAIFRIDPRTGNQTVVSASGLFGDPCGIAVVPALLDSDGDGVPDRLDQFPNTLAGAVVNSQGGSLAQLCPCDGPSTGRPWKSHGDFLNHFHKEALKFYRAGLLTKAQKNVAVREANQTHCGQRRGRDFPVAIQPLARGVHE